MTANVILFVCTGNIFRSMSAEHICKGRCTELHRLDIRSAGTVADIQEIHPVVFARLLSHGIDPSSHRQTKLNSKVVEGADLIVSMGRDHKAYIKSNFGRDSHLFNYIAHGRDEPVLDLHEQVPNFMDDSTAAKNYLEFVVDHVHHSMPSFLKNLEAFLKNPLK